MGERRRPSKCPPRATQRDDRACSRASSPAAPSGMASARGSESGTGRCASTLQRTQPGAPFRRLIRASPGAAVERCRRAGPAGCSPFTREGAAEWRFAAGARPALELGPAPGVRSTPREAPAAYRRRRVELGGAQPPQRPRSGDEARRRAHAAARFRDQPRREPAVKSCRAGFSLAPPRRGGAEGVPAKPSTALPAAQHYQENESGSGGGLPVERGEVSVRTPTDDAGR